MAGSCSSIIPLYRLWLRIMWFAMPKVAGSKPSSEATAENWSGETLRVAGSAPWRMMSASRYCGIEKVAASGLSSKVAGATGSSATVRVAVATPSNRASAISKVGELEPSRNGDRTMVGSVLIQG